MEYGSASIERFHVHLTNLDNNGLKAFISRKEDFSFHNAYSQHSSLFALRILAPLH